MTNKEPMEQPKYLMKMAQLNILDSFEDAPGVETLEGRIGPLLSAESGSVHYISMPPNMYCAPHKHSTESIIYTMKGEWVLCSEGERHHMKEGSFFYMPPNVETGYEVPFKTAATILIVKFEGPNNVDKFLTYLQGLKEKLEKQRASGEPFFLTDLPPDHPAIIFAKNIRQS